MIRFLRPFDPRRLRLLVFDLDGTLIDSRLDLIHSVNAMLRHLGRPELDGDVIASYVGDGAPALVRRALGAVDTRVHAEPDANVNAEADTDTEALFPSALEFFLGYYRVHKLDHTTVYEGIPEVLARLAKASHGLPLTGAPSTGVLSTAAPPTDVLSNGVPRQMAVLTNKPVRASRDIVQALGLGDFFVRIYGGNSFTTKKPDPLGVCTILEETGVPAQQALMIGDSSVDVLTGRNAGLWTCGVTYGFAPHSLEQVPPDVLVETPRDLGDLLR